MAAVPSPVLTTAGLIGGYLVARKVNRTVGGGVLAAAGAAAFEACRRKSGLGAASVVTGTYVAAFGLSHPLSKKMGAWPSVLTVTAVTGAAAYALADRRS